MRRNLIRGKTSSRAAREATCRRRERRTGRAVQYWIATVLMLLGWLSLAGPRNLLADTCPPGATSTGVGWSLTAYRSNSVTGQLTPISDGTAGACETIYLQATLSYIPFDGQGNMVAAFENGTMRIYTGTFTNNVTPVGGVPKIGPASAINNTNVCSPAVVTNLIGSRITPYIIQPADIGTTLTFFAQYENGDAHLGTNLTGVEGAMTPRFSVRIAGRTCSISPTNQTVCAGTSPSITVSGTGSGITYTWSGPNGFTASRAAITLTNVQTTSAGTYTATVKDRFGCTSACSATLAVNPATAITLLTGSTNCPGASVTFTTTASGTGPFTYVWKKNGVAIPGQTNNSLTLAPVSATNSGTYSVEVTGACGTISSSATLTVNGDLTATPLQSLVRCPGESATFITTNGGSGPFAYVWTFNGVVISGETNNSLTIGSVTSTNAGTYEVAVTGTCGSTNMGASLTINAPTTVSGALTSLVRCAGQSATFSATPGGTGPFTYAWTHNGTNLAGATNASLTINPVTAADAGIYCVTITGACNAATNCATLDVNQPTTVSGALTSLVRCAGQSATFSATPGGTGPFTYAWTHNGTNLAGATNASLTINPVSAADAGIYCVTITGACNSATNCATLDVNQPTTVSGALTSLVRCAGQSATFSATPGGTGPFA